MPPFAQSLSNHEVAAVVNWLRMQVNQDARPIDADDVSAMAGIE